MPEMHVRQPEFNYNASRPFTKNKYRINDLIDMLLIRKFNKGFLFLLCVIGIHSKYAWFVP